MKNLVRVLGVAAVVLASGAVPGAAQDRRSFAAGSYFLTLDGVDIGFLHSAEGGHATSDVVVEKLGPDRIARKHIAGVKYEDITVSCGLNMNHTFFDWIEASWKGNYARKDGSIHSLDLHLEEVSELHFTGALISEIGFPAMDAASKDSSKMTIKWTPEFTRKTKGSGKAEKPASKSQKIWRSQNFRLEIDGLDCSKAVRIEPLTVKQKIVEAPVGEERDPGAVSETTDFPCLKVTLATPTSQSWEDWFEDFVIRGNNSQDREKNGKLVLLAPDLKEVLLTINFKNLGIFKLEPPQATPRSCDCDLCKEVADIKSENAARKLMAELYCEQMELVSPPRND